MKKQLAAIALAATLIVAPVQSRAQSEVDLSGMTFDELIALQQQVNEALWASDGWQEGEVPSGYYEVGVDIPAGRWTVTGDEYIFVKIYRSMADLTKGRDWTNSFGGDAGSTVVLNLVDGQAVEVVYNPVIFKPGVSLGFK